MSSKKPVDTELNLHVLDERLCALMQQAQEAGWTRDAVKAARAANLEFAAAFRAHIRAHPMPRTRRYDVVRDPKTGEIIGTKLHIPKKRLPKKPRKETPPRDANRGP
jgi:hypothetical protein